MTAAPALPELAWEELVQYWQSLDRPNKAWRAEIIEESVVMTPPPGMGHKIIASRLNRALVQRVPEEWEIFQTAGVSVPVRRGLFMPDLVVVPGGSLPGEDAMPIPAEKTLLIVEITSKSNADNDRTKKLWAYAHGGVPLYLLIDRFASDGPTVFLYSGPGDGRYRYQEGVPFSEPVDLPEPFNLTLNTKEF